MKEGLIQKTEKSYKIKGVQLHRDKGNIDNK